MRRRTPTQTPTTELAVPSTSLNDTGAIGLDTRVPSHTRTVDHTKTP